ncbi:CLD18 protein, partial [Dyaphorophyia castanea]|nr:CLD18 protein [Platysteira castanea]
MSTTLCQVMGFLVSSLGVGGSIMATAMDTWSTQDLYDNPVTAVFQYQGLWRSCVRQSSGFTECRPYFTILGLPAMFQAVRALMIVGIVLGILGLLVCIFALKCIRIGSMEDTAKANMTLTSGIMFIVAGLCAITGVSVFANMLVTNFWMSTTNMYQGMQNVQNRTWKIITGRWSLLSALEITRGAGMSLSLQLKSEIGRPLGYKAVSYNASGRNISYRTGPYKVGSGYEADPKTRKGPGYEEAPRSEDGRRSYPSKYDYV